MIYSISLSHFAEDLGPTTRYNTTFATKGPNLPHGVKKGYEPYIPLTPFA